jgi:glycosyltransferase involved in cell wall biosynthesis
MKVSVVLTTARFGGVDVLKSCMLNQTLPLDHYEVIVVDDLYNFRQGALAQRPFVHRPRDNPKPYYDNSTGFNEAIRLAQGELVCFMVDYMWVPPDYLQRHWDLYKAHPGWSLTGYLDRHDYPPLKKALSPEMESVFAEPFDPSWFERTEPVYRERKGNAGQIVFDQGRDSGRVEMPGRKIYLIPDSVPMDVLRELNGLDEAYDGGYGSNDVDVGWRANYVGHRFELDPTLLAHKMGTKANAQLIPGVRRDWLRTPQENEGIFNRRVEEIKAGRESVAVPEGRGAWR